MNSYTADVKRGERFEFGKNWSRFLHVLDDDRVAQAEKSLQEMLETGRLDGQSFLDIGSGSGLFSLAARRLGAKVHSFDYDPQSVACTAELKQRYFPNDPDWFVEQGSALDRTYLTSLGKHDIVYSWGVLHHTGAMWEALDNVAQAVKASGKLCVAIYNDQGGWSRRWRKIKKVYNLLPGPLKTPYVLAVMMPRELMFLSIAVAKFSLVEYIKSWTEYSRYSLRGMSRWHDMVDWVGGYPFEVAKPEEIFDFYRKRTFTLRRLRTSGCGVGCNEFLFEKIKD
jgi:2-polyprenyl-3-methyl-5-hydroxy-6-metoxy-1,4-benzoquinol methylase